MDLAATKNIIEEYVRDLIDICPHCGAKVHIEKLWSAHHSYDNGDVEFYVIFRCRPCKKLLLKTYTFRQNRYTNSTNLEAVGWDEKFPFTLDSELSAVDSKYIPEEIFADYQWSSKDDPKNKKKTIPKKKQKGTKEGGKKGKKKST